VNIYEHPFKSAQLCTYELCNTPMVLYNVMGALYILHMI